MKCYVGRTSHSGGHAHVPRCACEWLDTQDLLGTSTPLLAYSCPYEILEQGVGMLEA